MKQDNVSKELSRNIKDSRNGLHYDLHGDYCWPNIVAEERIPLGKYGRARLRYLQDHRSNVYEKLLLFGKLYNELNETDTEAERLLEIMIPTMAKKAGITEALKATDPMKWVGLMNSIKSQVEEIIWHELICA